MAVRIGGRPYKKRLFYIGYPLPINSPAPSGTTYYQTPTMSAVGTAALQREVRLVRAFSGAGTSALARMISVAKAVSGVGTYTLQKQVNLGDKAYSAVGSVSLALGRFYTKSLTFTATGTYTLSDILTVGISRTFSAIGTAVMSGTYVPGSSGPDSIYQSIRRLIHWLR